MSLDTNHTEITTQQLIKFWKELPSDLQKNIGFEIAFIIGTAWSSKDFLTIAQDAISSKLPEDNAFKDIVNNILELDQDSQSKMKAKLTNYFITRNPK